jgi:dolichol-phosphate mannosyltransferase
MEHRSNLTQLDSKQGLMLAEDNKDSISIAAATRMQTLLSIVVPTKNEARNIEELINRLEQAVTNVSLEIIFVDDSDDDTGVAIEAVKARSRCDIRLVHRPPGQRSGGLGRAVVAGLCVARAPWVCVMDADLQHPPELIPCLLNEAERKDADLVVASRYCLQGDAGNFGSVRSAISHVFTTVTRLAFPLRLRGVSDPMSGFFLVRKEILDLDKLRPHGFKILLEILVRVAGIRVAEVPFQFGKRHAGDSKASFYEGVRYLSHLYQLRFNNDPLRFAKFLMVGLSSLFVSMLLLAVATEILGLHYLVSTVVAMQGSIVWNFGLTEYRVFSDRRQV